MTGLLSRDRRDQQAFGIGWGPRRHHFEAGRVCEPRLRVLAVEGAGAQAAIARRADHPRHRCAPAVVVGGGELDDAVKATRNKVGELHLDYRPHPHQRHAGAHADEGVLAHGSVEDAFGRVFVGKRLGHFEGAAEGSGHILAEDDHLRIARQFYIERLGDRGDVGQFLRVGHLNYPPGFRSLAPP